MMFASKQLKDLPACPNSRRLHAPEPTLRPSLSFTRVEATLRVKSDHLGDMAANICGTGGNIFVAIGTFPKILTNDRELRAMTIHVYSKPGCGKCDAAKSKLKLMGLNYTEHNLEHYVTHHDGWRTDGSADVMAAHTMMGGAIPLFRLNDEFHDYPTAMRKLKDTRMLNRA